MDPFSDGVLAITLTSIELERNVPHGEDLATRAPLIPVLLSYVLSFICIGINWNNHHHLLQATSRDRGGMLWANVHLFFWFSLLPFVTCRMGENPFSALPTALYGGVLLMASIAYWILARRIVQGEGKVSVFGRAIGSDCKAVISIVLHAIAIPLAFVAQ